MRVAQHLVAVLLLLVAAVSAATPGSFRGTVVEQDQAPSDSRWIYVQGRNGGIRRVDISHASITYDDDVPARSRESQPQLALVAGTEVRVTAEQGKDGEWRATRVEILSTARSHTPAQKLQES